MFDFSNDGAEICVVGRTLFHSGIGSIGFATAELLARNFPVSYLPTEPHIRAQDAIYLPNGRRLPVCKNPGQIKASFFCDVLWNGADDFNYSLMPPGSLKYAWLVYDSDQLPKRWTELLNTHFDLAVAASPHLVETAARNGVTTPVACLPIPIDLDGLLARPLAIRNERLVRFGCVAAFHPRKGVEVLAEAFLERYAGRTDVELVLHSNLAIGNTLDRVRALIERRGAANIRITHGSLSDDDKNALIDSFDIFVNCSRGEGYSIGPREAMAMGKVVVASDVGGHRDLAGPPGIFLVPPDIAFPARYPEIDNLTFGEQPAVSPAAVAAALETALGFVHADPHNLTAQARRDRAREWSFSRLASSIGALIDPSIRRFRATPTPPLHVDTPPEFDALVERRLGSRADRIGGLRRNVCPAYDAGFFSIFNAFISHLVWQQREDRCHAVLPDWDIGRLNDRIDGRAQSFCYGQPGDGNLWLKLFQPLFGATEADMNDRDYLWRHAESPFMRHNEDREPLMTYVHAYKLYQSADFTAFRRQYGRVFRQHVQLRPELAAEIDAFAAARLRAPCLIGAHVRHPSHTVEQPGAVIAHTEAYIDAIHDQLRHRGVAIDGPGWAVFLATDQEKVVRRFQHAFGDRLAYYPDVRRTRADEDAAFDALSAAEQNRDGHQLQHLVAADPSNWSARMAWEVVRDAYTMARCECLLHVVSNVSTAVAYMNPSMDMIFCSA